MEVEVEVEVEDDGDRGAGGPRPRVLASWAVDVTVVVVVGRRRLKTGMAGSVKAGSSAYSMCVLLAPGVPSGRKCWMWWYVVVVVVVEVGREPGVGRAYSMCSAVGPSAKRDDWVHKKAMVRWWAGDVRLLKSGRGGLWM